jgi:hypothetical protein
VESNGEWSSGDANRAEINGRYAWRLRVEEQKSRGRGRVRRKQLRSNDVVEYANEGGGVHECWDVKESA